MKTLIFFFILSVPASKAKGRVRFFFISEHETVGSNTRWAKTCYGKRYPFVLGHPLISHIHFYFYFSLFSPPSPDFQIVIGTNCDFSSRGERHSTGMRTFLKSLGGSQKIYLFSLNSATHSEKSIESFFMSKSTDFAYRKYLTGRNFPARQICVSIIHSPADAKIS